MRRVLILTMFLILSAAVHAGTRGTLAVRPAATTAAADALYVVTDCATAACTSGGATMECVTQNLGTAWDVVVCGTTTSTTSTSTSTSTTTTT